jgi:DNA-binding response OmpR family regulator
MKKVLLVEDDRQLAENIADILILHGYVVCWAVNGDEGQQALFFYKPDLIVSDVLMPGMNGIELVECLRRNPLHRHIPVILLSAKTSEHDIQKGKDAGANIYLKKPFDADELVMFVGKLLA